MVASFGRLRMLLLVVAITLLAAPVLSLSAQDASPEADGSLLGALGLPVLEITVTPDGVERPTEIVAGPQLLVIHNQIEGPLTSTFAVLPDGITDEQYLEAASSEGPLPDWLGDAVIAGGLDQDPGTTASAIIDLAPGTWSVVLTSDGAEVAEPVLQLTAAGEVPDGATDSIPTDLVVNLGEYVFDFPDTVPAGPQIWQVTNSHTVPHHLILFGADRLYTADEITCGLAALFMGTPPAEDGFVPAEFILGTSLLSGGISTWIEADLEPGYYVAICFLPDPGGEDPHAFMGMVDSFEVTA